MTGKPKAASLSGLLARKGEAPPPQAVALRSEPEGAPIGAEADEKGGAPLNFRVKPELRRAFKTYAAQHDLKLNELLRLAFEEYRERHP